MLVPPEKLSELKETVDIVEIISDYLPLKKAGRRYKALCPFHQDKDPSFYVTPDRQNYRCFGCGASGDVISFLQEMDHLSFPEAIRALAQRAGVEIELGVSSGHTSAILQANEFACRYYEHILHDTVEGKPGRDYLGGRGIGKEAIKRFRLGYAPAGWESLKLAAAQKGTKESDLMQAGLLSQSSKGSLIDFFRQRLMFPILDTRSRVIGFGGRVLDDSLPKYINSPESPLFKKSEALYGLNLAKGAMFAQRRAIVTEGYTDVIKAHENGIETAVATLGTAFTENHARVLKRFVDTVYVVFDSDSAGRAAAERSLEILLGQELGIRVIGLPSGSDLFDYLGSADSGGFERLREEAVEFLDFKYRSVAQRHDLATTRGRAAAADELLSVLKSIGNPVLRNMEIKRVANLVGAGEAELQARLHIGAPAVTAGRRTAPGSPELRDMDLIDIMLNRPDMTARVMDVFPPECYCNSDFTAIASVMYREFGEKGTVSTSCVFESEDGERLRARILDVLRYGSESRDEERDYETIFAAWVARKEEQHLASEIRNRSDEPSEALVDYFNLKKKIRQKP